MASCFSLLWQKHLQKVGGVNPIWEIFVKLDHHFKKKGKPPPRSYF